MAARFNYYPHCPRPELTLGIQPHADGSAITYLLQDKEVEGLQILIGDQWFTVPNVPDALLVNVGDQVEVIHIKLCLQHSFTMKVGNKYRHYNVCVCVACTDNE